MARPILEILSILVLPLVPACVGRLDDGPTRSDGREPTTCTSEEVAPAALPHLTRSEYDRTVRDLLGDHSAPARGFPADDGIAGYATGATVSSLHVESWLDAAEALAAHAAEDPIALASCDPEREPEAGCLVPFLARFGRRAFRRPLSGVELDRLLTLYRQVSAVDGASVAFEAVLTAILASPSFLYHTELAAPSSGEDGVTRLDGYALAARMAFFLWGAGPDDALLDAAEAGQLDDAEGADQVARDMLRDPHAREGLRELVGQWLGLARLDGVVRAGLAPDMPGRMRASAEAFVDAVLFEDDARLATLLGASWTFADGPLAEILDVPGPEGDALVRVELDPAERAGLLTHPALMTLLAQPAQSDPVRRGVWVLDRLLCDALPPPPMDVTPPEVSVGATTRERFAQHTSSPACQGCHSRIDPIGFGFEHYDATGRFRTEEAGIPVDATGHLDGTGDSDGDFDGAPELAARLAGSAQVEGCFATQAFRFAAARREAPEDACSLERATQDFRRSGGDIRELAVAIATSDPFRFRRVDALDGRTTETTGGSR